jgi:D-3-phosphoglycerate dehydrogenase
MHGGQWNKTAAGAHEVRGLVLGIVGYGRIGSQLSDLTEALGMRVIFSEVADVARGNAKRCSFEEVLRQTDIVSLHVDGKPGNRNLFGDEELRLPKQAHASRT